MPARIVPPPIRIAEGAAFIALQDGSEVVIDVRDVAVAAGFRWVKSYSSGGRFYIAARKMTNKKRKIFFLHKLIMQPPPGFVVDHINRNVLDNRRQNLRVCTPAENAKNNGGIRGRALPKGVILFGGKYHARICCDGRRYYLGVYDKAEAAAAAYNEAAARLHADFACFNAAAIPGERRRHKRIQNDVREDVIRRHGFSSANKVASDYKISISTVTRIWRSAGLTVAPSNRPPIKPRHAKLLAEFER